MFYLFNPEGAGGVDAAVDEQEAIDGGRWGGVWGLLCAVEKK